MDVGRGGFETRPCGVDKMQRWIENGRDRTKVQIL